MPPSTRDGPRALVLLSGGLDSAVTAAVARFLGYRLHGVTFEYGQRHIVETERAVGLARSMGLESHHAVRLDPFPAGSSALTDRDVAVPVHRELEAMGSGPIPATYVPARNTIFLANALAWCEHLRIADIFLGVNALDYSGYPDCRPEFLRAFEDMARLATRAGVEEGVAARLRAPLLHRTKAEIIRLGSSLGVDFAATWSCYDPVSVGGGRQAACGICDSCSLRRRGFLEAGVPDPTPYRDPGAAGSARAGT